MRRSRTLLLYRDTSLAIEFNQMEEWLYVNWRGYQSYDSVVTGYTKVLELMKASACYRVLNDNTQVEGQWSAASRWLAEEWFPEMEREGLKLFAWVYSPSVLSRLSADKAVKLADYPSYIQAFEDIEPAKDWLRSHL